jgi:uncharacterized membrane protein YozB (DUF420 family)
MATTTSARAPSFVGLRKAVLLVVAGVALYFLYDESQYFVWSEESYGYYWAYRAALALHLTGGFVALLTGVFQLWTGLNGSAMRAHPWTGRVYLTGVVAGSVGAISLAFSSVLFGLPWDVALVSLALAWLAITGTAFFCIRRRNLKAHKQWMIRSYILTFAFVTFRIVTEYLPYEAWWGITPEDMSNAMIWPVWVLPLLVYEISLQYRAG